MRMTKETDGIDSDAGSKVGRSNVGTRRMGKGD